MNKYIIIIMIAIASTSCRKEYSNIYDYDYDLLTSLNINLVNEFGLYADSNQSNIGQFILTSYGNLLVYNSENLETNLYSEEGDYLKSIKYFNEIVDSTSSGYTIYDMGFREYLVRTGSTRKYINQIADTVFVGEPIFISTAVPERGRWIEFSKSKDIYYGRSTDFSTEDSGDGYYYQYLMVADKSGTIMQDSIASLAYPVGNIINLSEERATRIHTQYEVPDALRQTYKNDGSYIIIRPRLSEIYIYNHRNEKIKKIEMRNKVNKQSDEHLEYTVNISIPDVYSRLFKIPETSINRLKVLISNMRRPAFLNLWAGTDKYLLQVDILQDVQQFMIIDSDGKALGKLELSKYDNVQYYRDDKIYSLYSDPENGNIVKTYSVSY